MGTTAGVTMYSIRGDVSKSLDKILGATNGIVTTRPVTGFYGGSYANIPVTENFSIEPGLYYATKGYAVQHAYTFKALIF